MSEGAFLCEQRPDLITPVKIEHLLDEFIHEGECFARYNYLDYFFEKPRLLHARPRLSPRCKRDDPVRPLRS